MLSSMLTVYWFLDFNIDHFKETRKLHRSRDVRNRFFYFGCFKKNLDFVRNEFGSVRFKKTLLISDISYLLLV